MNDSLSTIQSRLIRYEFLPQPIDAVLLDLDGTIADTAPDLIHTLNRLLAENQRPPVLYADYRSVVSRGSRGLIMDAFNISAEHNDYLALRQRYLDLYQEMMFEHAALFEGMDAVLRLWEQDGIPWGVVTNKPWRFTEPLMNQLGLLDRAGCVVTPDHVTNAKPDPEPVLLGCRLLGRESGKVLFIGDAHQDMASGRAAGVTTLLAKYGYLQPQQRTANWPTDGEISQPVELLNYFLLES